ncbi:hypothetical protein ZHAS_00009502 [Anopheles sinensis]|uniref:Uncharacterized protein n=1 Tax=Anopheles sinensis TaxID=74873 RepID=A0A084VVE4_ANOSI|nr:hypothetical protein ZHAS_00009502 [Anopheles sinensis]
MTPARAGASDYSIAERPLLDHYPPTMIDKTLPHTTNSPTPSLTAERTPQPCGEGSKVEGLEDLATAFRSRSRSPQVFGFICRVRH